MGIFRSGSTSGRAVTNAPRPTTVKISEGDIVGDFMLPVTVVSAIHVPGASRQSCPTLWASGGLVGDHGQGDFYRLIEPVYGEEANHFRDVRGKYLAPYPDFSQQSLRVAYP